MPTYRVTARGLNIRSGPGKGYESVNVLLKNEVIISPNTAGWLPVEMEDGGYGWASAQYLEKVEDAPAKEPPIATPPAGKVIYESQLTSLFGQPRDPAPHLKLMDFSEFKAALGHVKDYLGNYWSFRIWGHHLLEAPLRQAFRNLIERGHGAEWRTYEGCLNIRPKTSGGSYSTHAWGLAIDLNAKANGYGRKPTLSAGFVKCFTDAGFTWGGTWRGRGGQNDYSACDAMHFQLPKT